jgi:hypothetical protein
MFTLDPDVIGGQYRRWDANHPKQQGGAENLHQAGSEKGGKQ